MVVAVYLGKDGLYYATASRTVAEVKRDVMLASGVIKFQVEGKDKDDLGRAVFKWMEEEDIDEIYTVTPPRTH